MTPPKGFTDYHIAACYIRVSTEEQTELSPASQLVEIRKWAASHGYIVPDEFVFSDEGITGRKVVGRDAFRRMISVAKSKPKPFDAILLWKFSRFARNRDDAVFYKSILRKQLGIEVISISEPVAEGKMGIITEALIEAMDEYYSINLSEEVKRGMEEKHRRGELQTTPSFGYTVENGVLVPAEPEASYVKEIFHRFVSGEGYQHISIWLNSIGVKTHRGNSFENRGVEYIIRNPVYIGKLRWNPNGITRRNYSDPHIVIVDGKHEPLIDMETWEAAQARVAELKAMWRYHGRPLGSNKDWITGLVRCASCGSTLVFSAPHYWKCNGYIRGRCKTSQHIPGDLLKSTILRRLQSDAASSVPILFDTIRVRDCGDDNLSALQSQKAALEKKIERLRDAYLAGADTVEEYRAAKEATQTQLNEVAQQIQAYTEETTSIGTQEAMRSAIEKALQTITSDTASIEQKSEAARSIIDHIIFDKASNRLEIHYRFIF